MYVVSESGTIGLSEIVDTLRAMPLLPDDLHSAAQVKLDIPEDITVTDIQLSGFMTGATYLNLGLEHRFFRLSANGEKSGSLILSVTVQEGISRTISLCGVNLLDSAGKPVPIDTPLPAYVVISQKETATVSPAVKPLDFWPYAIAIVVLTLPIVIFTWRREMKDRQTKPPYSIDSTHM